MSEHRKVTISWKRSQEFTEGYVRNVVEHGSGFEFEFIDACKAWVEANPEKEPLPSNPHSRKVLRLLRLGENTGGAYVCGSAFAEQSDYCSGLGISPAVVDGVTHGDYDEELGLTEIIRLLGEL